MPPKNPPLNVLINELKDAIEVDESLPPSLSVITNFTLLSHTLLHNAHIDHGAFFIDLDAPCIYAERNKNAFSPAPVLTVIYRFQYYFPSIATVESTIKL